MGKEACQIETNKELIMTEISKIAFNACFGGFGLSAEATRMFLTLKGIPFEERVDKFKKIMFCEPGGEDWSLYDVISDVDRHDPILIEVIEKLGDKASGPYSYIKLYEVPKGSLYYIEEYDGSETVMTPDTANWIVAT
jgi:hypothetical protein